MVAEAKHTPTYIDIHRWLRLRHLTKRHSQADRHSLLIPSTPTTKPLFHLTKDNESLCSLLCCVMCGHVFENVPCLVNTTIYVWRTSHQSIKLFVSPPRPPRSPLTDWLLKETNCCHSELIFPRHGVPQVIEIRSWQMGLIYWFVSTCTNQQLTASQRTVHSQTRSQTKFSRSNAKRKVRPFDRPFHPRQL